MNSYSRKADRDGHHLCGEISMLSRFGSWIVVATMVAGLSGCEWLRPSAPTMMVEVDVPRQDSSVYSPTESVNHMITDLLAILGKETLRQPSQFEERRRQIEQVIRRRVNYEHMAQRSLGASWGKLNAPQREEFLRLFVELIRDRIANKIDQYSDERVIYLLERREGRFAEVRTQFAGPKADTEVDFRLEKRSDHWLVYDVVIDGSSIVMNYRTQFTRIIRDVSYQGLVEKMGQQVLTVKVFEKAAPAIALSQGTR